MRVARRLPSLADPDGSSAIGPSDVSFRSRLGFLTIGLGANPALRGSLPPAGARMDKLYRMGPFGGLREVADIGAFEAAHNPAAGQPGDQVDSNADAVLARRRGRSVVVDAGGNDVLSVSRRGHVSVLGVILFSTAGPGLPLPPGAPIQSVPTSVVKAPHGGYYVGQLTGFPFPVGGASVWFVKRGQAPRVVASGFTQITGLGRGRDGSLYVLEIATGSMAGPPTPGALIRVRRSGRREELAAGRLTSPTGLLVTRRFAYVSDRGTSAGGGRIVRIPLHRR